MKHILPLLILAFLGATAPVFADPAFTDPVFDGITFNDIDPYTNQYWQGVGNGSYYTIRFNGSGTFYLSSIRNSNYGDQNEYLTNSIYGITHYGYIDSNNDLHKFEINDPKNIVEFTSMSESAPGLTVTREGYFLGNFEAGQEIQIYLDGNIDGKAVWSATNSPQTEVYSSRFGGKSDLSNPSMRVGQLFFGDENSSEMNFSIVASGQSYVAGGNNGGPSGSPLPGGFSIALVSGLFALGFWYVRSRKAIEA